MKTRYQTWIWLTIAVSLLSLGACRPIEYYLTNVYKLHGKVTIADTVPPTPLGSVEVTVGNHHYSELTNYYGDYEMEMAEGTWTINITKEGFLPVTEEVTVGPGNPRVRLDVEMEWVEPPAPLDLTGWWDVYFEIDGEIVGPDKPFYIQQDGFQLTCSNGLVGTLDGPTIRIEKVSPDDYGLLTGIASANLIEGTLTIEEDGEVEFEGGMRLERPPITPFGHLDIFGDSVGGPLSLDTEYAVGEGGEPETTYKHSLDLGPSIGTIGIETQTINPGMTYWISDEDLEEDTAAAGVFTADGRYLQAAGGSFSIEAYSTTGMSGSLVLEFEDGSALSGPFHDMVFDSGAGAVTLNGQWPGVTFPQVFTSVWSTAEISVRTAFDVWYQDHELDMCLTFRVSGVPGRGVTYYVPTDGSEWPENALEANVQIRFPDDLAGDLDATSGSLTVLDYSEDGIAGTFTFDQPAAVSGSFDVTFIETLF